MHEGPITLIVQAIVGLIRDVFLLSRWMVGASPRTRARRQARAAERASRARQQQWFEGMQRQMARGKGGYASPEEARKALRGRGGRRSPLDDRMI
jgi:hypothetical protein